jgi:glycosyltransferase involved in cell wall biosynthesis
MITNHTSVSIIVPAYNEAKVVEACVRSILAHCPAGTEVIVVDDGSLDPTYSVTARLSDEAIAVIVAHFFGFVN